MKKIVNNIREFNRFYTSIIGVVDGQILESPYSLTEVRVMYEIYYGENITVRKLRNILKLDEGYLSRLITSLQKRKLLTKNKSKDDNRVYELQLTSKGKKEYLELDDKSSKLVEKMIVHLTDTEIKALVNKMNEIRNFLKRNE